MSKHDEARRAFLKGAALGASAVAGAGLVPQALAQAPEQVIPRRQVLRRMRTDQETAHSLTMTIVSP